MAACPPPIRLPVLDSYCDESLQQYIVQIIRYNVIRFICLLRENELVLRGPGTPGTSIELPDIIIPGVPGRRVPLEARLGNRLQGWIGHRFPMRLRGGTLASNRFLRGSGDIRIPGLKQDIPGAPGWERIIRWYNTIIQAINDSEVLPEPLPLWTQPWDCSTPPPIDALADIGGGGGGQGPDGRPLPGSTIPTFGPGSGGPGSCWSVTGGSFTFDQQLGKWVAKADPGTRMDIELRCECAPTWTGGGVEFGLTVHDDTLTVAMIVNDSCDNAISPASQSACCGTPTRVGQTQPLASFERNHPSWQPHQTRLRAKVIVCPGGSASPSVSGIYMTWPSSAPRGFSCGEFSSCTACDATLTKFNRV